MTCQTKKIILRAPLLTFSGYGTHARQIARWLIEKEQEAGSSIKVTMDPVQWGDTPWIVDPEAEDGLIGKILQRCNKQKSDTFDLSLQLQLPNEWNPFLADKNIGLTAAVEADRCNPTWIENCNRMDLVITPSEFAKKALTASGNISVPIVVVPESFPDELLANSTNEDNLDFGIETDFNFLIFGQVTGNTVENDRKNLAYTLKWICEEFDGREDIGVVVKTNMGRQSALDRIKTTSMLSNLLMQVKKSDKGPRIYLLHGAMNDKEIARLYRHPKIKALVSLTRGEGFGLPLLEAAASGLPIIATDWSAHTEFLNNGKWIKVDYSLVEIDKSRVDQNIWMPSARWAMPKEEDFKKKLRKFVSSSALPTTWAADLKDVVLQKYSFEEVKQQYNATLKDFLQ
jgi:glycosyltransferase involved in cell wall biosynthesis